MGHWVDTLVILGVTVINALIGHIQESNAEKSLQGIRNMLSSDARVQRNGKHETIPTRDLVPGDIVILRAGDRVPADMRLIETHNLRVEEAILTGESTVVDKITDALEGDLPLGDRVNMVFSGTTVSAGGGQQHVNQYVVKVGEKAQPARFAFLFRQRIRPTGIQALGGVCGT